ncbi:hypothetical protein Peur_062757 [Populus x canadensis]
MVTLVANTFKSPYYEYLMGSFTQHFYDVVVIVGRIKYPNINFNPLPNHVSSSGGVNIVEYEGKKKQVLRVNMDKL